MSGDREAQNVAPLSDFEVAMFEDVFCGPWCNDRRGAHGQIEAQVLPVVARLLAGARADERERVAHAIEDRQFATGLNWTARDTFAIAARIARGDA